MHSRFATFGVWPKRATSRTCRRSISAQANGWLQSHVKTGDAPANMDERVKLCSNRSAAAPANQLAGWSPGAMLSNARWPKGLAQLDLTGNSHGQRRYPHYCGVSDAMLRNTAELLWVSCDNTHRLSGSLSLKKNRSFQGPKKVTSAIQQRLQQALALLQQGMLSDAKTIYEDILKQIPNQFDALNLLGVIACLTEDSLQGEALFSGAIKVNPRVAEAHNNRGIALTNLERFEEAVASFDKAITLRPNYAEAHNNRGSTLNDLKRLDEAVASFDKAIALNPNYAEAYYNRGNALADIRRSDEALASYDKSIALNPYNVEVHNNRGNLLIHLKRYDEAFAAYDKVHALKPDLPEAWLGRGNALLRLKRFDEAIASFDKAITLRPNYTEAHNNRGSALNDLKRLDEALASLDKAIALKPDYAEAFYNRGIALSNLKRLDDAFASYERASSLEADLVGLEGAHLHAKMHFCDWSRFDEECAHLISSVKQKKANTTPFALFGISSSPNDQFQCAKLWAAEKCPQSLKIIWKGERYRHDRIRVAYASADLREHPVSLLIAGMLECHDKSRFDVTAISFGPDDNSPMRKRLKGSEACFVDVRTLSDEQIANFVRSSEVDILVDLMGFTAESRTGVFARRPAPIAVNYLGYAGTMGAPYIDYILADRIVIPTEKLDCYSEKVVHLPDSFMATDSKRRISERLFRRSEFSLPEAGFVFCSFNNSYKIVPQIFDIWMRLLKQLDNSVLWLSNANETAIRNLKREAQNRGVDPDRLVLAQRLPLNEDHLARHGLADLFLDTLPYNAHATASDALWAGLPVLTCLGETFAGRVAASLLNAIGLPELIAPTLERYEQIAIELATRPEKLAAIKRKLTQHRLTTPLFDTRLFTRHIEAAYTAMYERYQAGLAPDHVVVPD
jgi:protein O-GlcNAc transferase